MRSRRQPAENHERWLVSYADFITLMFAFFVVMFATSQVNKKRMANMAAAYSSYLGGEESTERGLAADSALMDAPADGVGHTPGNHSFRERLTRAEMIPIKKRVEKRLTALVAGDKVAVRLLPRGLVLSLREAAFFDTGKDTFRTGAKPLLHEVGQAMQEITYQPIRLEGHTDNVPILTKDFSSNWDLSTAREIQVMNALKDEFGLPPERLSVSGYGAGRPIADNRTPEGRAVNRRVDIVILSQSAAAMAPRQRLAEVEPGAEAAARVAVASVESSSQANANP